MTETEETTGLTASTGRLNEDDRNLHWYLVSTAVSQEDRLRKLFLRYIDPTSPDAVKNIQDAFLPIHTDGKPAISCRLFVYGIEKAIRDFMGEKYTSGHLLYDSANNCPIIIPDDIMQDFRNLYEHYSNDLVILEKPYQHFYSHINKRTGKKVLNLRARILDGPFAGHTGFIFRMKKNNCLAFKLSSNLCISITHAWNYRLERIPDAHEDYMSVASQLGRDIDYLIDILQASGFTENYQQPLRHILSSMQEQPSIQFLINHLNTLADTQINKKEYKQLIQEIQNMPFENMAALTRLVQYIQENKLKTDELSWANTYQLHPFLTPSSLQSNESITVIRHTAFTEYILPYSVTQEKYDHTTDKTFTDTETYFAHVYGKKEGQKILLFANWDKFLRHYKAFEERARMVQDYQIKINCPALYNVLHTSVDTQLHTKKLKLYPIKTSKDVQSVQVNCLVKEYSACDLNDAECIQPILNEFVQENVNLCRHIDQSTHLHFWRSNLHTVWLCK